MLAQVGAVRPKKETAARNPALLEDYQVLCYIERVGYSNFGDVFLNQNDIDAHHHMQHKSEPGGGLEQDGAS